jgi:hypothetical protein
MSEIFTETPGEKVTAETPGQAAYEAYIRFVGLPPEHWPSSGPGVNLALWDAVAQAVIAAQRPQPEPEPKAAPEQLRYERDQAIGMNENLRTQLAEMGTENILLVTELRTTRGAKAAPELAAAMAETQQVRNALGAVMTEHREQCEQLVKLIYDLEGSQQQTSPSKKSDIERGVISRLQAILHPKGDQ